MSDRSYQISSFASPQSRAIVRWFMKQPWNESEEESVYVKEGITINTWLVSL